MIMVRQHVAALNSFFGKCAAGFRSSAVPAPPLLNPTHWPRSRVPWLGTGFGDSRVNEVTRRGRSLGWTGCSVTVDVKHHLGVCPAKLHHKHKIVGSCATPTKGKEAIPHAEEGQIGKRPGRGDE